MSLDNIKLRPTTPNDLMLIFEWANDPLVRKMSFNSNPISLTEHTEWFYKTINDADQHLLIAEILLDGSTEFYAPCGQLRFNTQGEIGILIAPQYRGKHLAASCLNAAVAYIKDKKKPYAHITAYIKMENSRSVKAFESAGFVAAGTSLVKNEPCLKYIYLL